MSNNNSQQAPQHPTRMISDPAELEEICQQLANTPVLALDTEFVRDKTYFPKLCLLQLAADDIVACIDPLAIRDLSPLKTLLASPGMTKVFHAARQDMEILLLTFDLLPAPVFDTQVAATLLGLGEQIGYANLVSHYLKINVPKGHARADWEQRPLSAEQIEYAANDVRYLLQIYPLMTERLSSLGRLDWLTDDFSELTQPDLYAARPDTLWQRISGQQKLRGVQVAVLQKLAAWREQLAQQINRPRKWVLPDDMLITLSMQMPTRLEQLSRIRGLNASTIDKNGKQILAVIAEATALPESQWPRPEKRKKPNKQQDAQVDALMSIIKLQAAKHEISSGAITSKSDIEKLVMGNRDVPLLHGWRMGVAGQQVTDFLDGKSSLHLRDNQLELV